MPCRAQADLVFTVGNCSGRDLDKFERLGLQARPGAATGAPLIEGCVAWLECRLLPEPAIQSRYDLFLGEVVAAQADDRVFSRGRWHFAPEHEALRTLHHMAGGLFFSVADPLQATMRPT